MLETESKLTAVTGQSPMGQYLRQYWLPAILPSDVPERDGEPYRLRLLGESLIAFRDTEGAVGILRETCAHRGVSLFYGRNEECGLRCVFHGWKYDVNGRVVDMPNEPPESTFKEKIRPIGYPTAEAGGVIWVFMGSGQAPPLPDFGWMKVETERRFITKRYQDCNWLPVVEGGIDSSHVSFLHAVLESAEGGDQIVHPVPGIADVLVTGDGFPRFDVAETGYGFMVAARRTTQDDSQYYWRITQMILPFYWMAPTEEDGPYYSCKMAVPVDDDNTINWTVSWNPHRALDSQTLASLKSGSTQHVVDFLPADSSKAYGNCRPRQNRRNVYEVDRDVQRKADFTGVYGLGMQDQYMQESIGARPDQSIENLGSSDLGVIKYRRRLLQELRNSDENRPYLHSGGSLAGVRGVALFLDKQASWAQKIVDDARLPDTLLND